MIENVSAKRLHWIKETITLVALDALDRLRGRHDPLIPPRRLLYDGPRDPQVFRENGREFLTHYCELCRLVPDESVLDVGSGMGRKTVPLTGYLSPRGRYDGLDVNRRGVSWCRKRISRRFANFQFHHIDVFNSRYNPRGVSRDSDYELPFPADSFDFVVIASVFTHMLPAGVKQYLRQTARVLRPENGRCLISFFLLNSDSMAGITSSRSAFNFPHRFESHAIEDAHQPEAAVAYDESFVLQLYAEAGLEVTAVYPGSWSGREDHLSFQDLLVAKPAGRGPG